MSDFLVFFFFLYIIILLYVDIHVHVSLLSKDQHINSININLYVLKLQIEHFCSISCILKKMNKPSKWKLGKHFNLSAFTSLSLFKMFLLF